MDHYTTLGVKKNATKEEIKRAARKKKQKAHPDKGGNSEMFHAIQIAEDVLTDDARRFRYDAGEEINSTYEPTAIEMARAEIISLFLFMVENVHDIVHVNMIENAMKEVLEREKKLNDQLKLFKHKIRKRESVMARIKRKKPGNNFLAQALANEIDKMKRQTKAAEEQFEIMKHMKDILSEYDYEAEIVVVRKGLFDLETLDSDLKRFK